MNSPRAVHLCRLPHVVLLGLFLAVSSESKELTAVVTQVGDKVNMSTKSPDIEARLVRPLDILRVPTDIVVPDGGHVGLVCSSEHWISLSGPARWTLSVEGCQGGRPLDPGTYRTMAPPRDRFRSVEGVLVLERRIHKYVGAATILSPRQSAVDDPRPRIEWSHTAKATEYVLELEGLDEPLGIPISEIECEERAEWDTKVCSLAFPEKHPGLEPERPLELQLGYRTFPTLPPQMGNRVEIELLSKSGLASLERELALLRKLPLSESELALFEAKIHAGHRLYADAIAVSQRALALSPDVGVELQLAALYLEVDLYPFALELYEALSQMDGDPVVRAEATFALGRVFAATGNWKNAQPAFEEAGRLYAALGKSEEQALASKAAADSAARLQAPSSRR